MAVSWGKQSEVPSERQGRSDGAPSLIERLKRAACKNCGVIGRRIAGPQYDRNKTRCMECGDVRRVKGDWS